MARPEAQRENGAQRDAGDAVINDDDFKIFPTRFGGSVGKALENKMLDAVGGANSIRTRIIGNTMLRTRGGFPEFTTLKEPVIIESASRTFVFRNIGATTGVVANRDGSGMKVAKTLGEIGNSSYLVLDVRTDASTLWFDVLRWESTSALLNAKTAPFIPGTLPSITSLGPSNLPVIVSRATPLAGGATRSPVMVAVSDPAGRKVVSIGVDGSEVSQVVPSNSGSYRAACSSEVGMSDGGYQYSGMSYTTTSGAVSKFRTFCSTITVTPTSPYIEETAVSNTEVDIDQDHGYGWPSLNRYRAATPVETGSLPLSHDVNGSYRSEYVSTPVLVPNYAYIGSDFNVQVRAELEGLYTQEVVRTTTPWPTNPSVIWKISVDHDGAWNSTKSFEATMGAVSVLSVDVNLTGSFTYRRRIEYFPTTDIQTSVSEYSVTYTAGSKDFIYLDLENEVSLALVAAISGGETYETPASFGPLEETSGSTTLVLNYVLTVGTSVTTFNVFSGDIRPLLGSAPSFNDQSNNLLNPPLRVPVVVAPKFLNQGNCPYIAYTTRAEELNGATHEFYLDISLIVDPWTSTATRDIYDGDVHFIPHNLHTLVTTHLFGNPYVPIRSDEVDDWMRSTALGLAIFPADTPFRIQFANGTSGPWQGQLGAGFSNGTPVVISRL